MIGLRHPAAALLGVVASAGLVALTGAGEVVGGGVATACAQTTPTVSTNAIPTVGPIDPACSRVPDTDNDNVIDAEDNCNGYFNPSQRDTDNDSGEPPYEPVRTGTMDRDPATGGDACDVDDDGDGVDDVSDNCQKIANKDQSDRDFDGIGDKCDEKTVVPGSGGGDRSGDGAPAPSSSPSGSSGGGPSSSGPAARPALTVFSFPRRRRVAEMREGLAVPVRCSAACAVVGEIVVTRRTAKRMKVARRGASTVIGRGTARLGGAGRTFVFVRVPAAGLKGVARARRVDAKLRLVVTDSAGGNRSSVERRVQIRR